MAVAINSEALKRLLGRSGHQEAKLLRTLKKEVRTLKRRDPRAPRYVLERGPRVAGNPMKQGVSGEFLSGS
jgi:hypothetical protein